jgi:hypothetical protein
MATGGGPTASPVRAIDISTADRTSKLRWIIALPRTALGNDRTVATSIANAKGRPAAETAAGRPTSRSPAST